MASPPAPGSTVLAQEYFDAADDRFLDEIRRIRSPKALAGLADRWKTDPRPWARRQTLAYLDLPLDAPGHQPVVKRLFKQAERQRDDELMAAFAVAFDRLVRRERRTRFQYDAESRESWREEYLAAPRNTMPGAKEGRTPRARSGALLYSYRTRYHLRRRAWRYFRRMGFQRPADYVAAVAGGLARYGDADLAKGEAILDSWFLAHACFGGGDVLAFGVSHAALRDGRGLGDLAAAPRFPDLWRDAAAFDVLLGLVPGARSRLVRVWAIQFLRGAHAERLAAVPAEALARLLEHDDEEVQIFGADLLRRAAGAASLPVEAWLQLAATRNLTALQAVCDAMAEHVPADRLDLAQCLELACAAPAPAARLGLTYLQARPAPAAAEFPRLAAVAGARCPAVAADLAAWALGVVGTRDAFDRETVSRLADSASRGVREAVWSWLHGDGSPGYDDAVLWARLLETPHDDLRLRLVDALAWRARLPGVDAGGLAPLWCSVLLNVHRGGRQKLKAVRQVSDAIRRDPAGAEALLPLLAVALRSVRPPEARAGLAAVVGAVDARPELAEAVRRHLPELDLAPA